MHQANNVIQGREHDSVSCRLKKGGFHILLTSGDGNRSWIYSRRLNSMEDLRCTKLLQ